MKIWDAIQNRFGRNAAVLYDNRVQSFFNGFALTQYQFAELIWLNICDILTDLCEDVKIEDASGAAPLSDAGMKYAAFRTFFYSWGKALMQKVLDNGFAVVAYDPERASFKILIEGTDYSTPSEDNKTLVVPHNPMLIPYVLKSSTFVVKGRSDKAMCKGWLDYLDDVLNGSATINRKMGVVVMASPKNAPAMPTPVILTDEQKKAMQKDMETEYGCLKKQSIVNVLPREMDFQTINLAGLETRTQERIKTAILAIVDRIKIPANQVAIIDANSSKQLANGSELREGDRLKYKTYRRLFEHIFVDMAMEYRLSIRYSIDGEPIGNDGAEVNAE